MMATGSAKVSAEIINVARRATTKEDFEHLMRLCIRRGIFPDSTPSVYCRAYRVRPDGSLRQLKSRTFAGTGPAKNSMRHHGAGIYILRCITSFEVVTEETQWKVTGSYYTRRELRQVTSEEDGQ